MPDASTFNHWSHEEVTVYIFWCLAKINTLTVLLLSFEVFEIWPFLTFDLFSVGRMKRSPWTFFDVWPRLTHWQCYFYHFTFVIWPFLTFDPLNHRSGEEVTLDTFWCLTPTNTLAVLVLPFKIVQNLTPFFDLWPLFRRSNKEVTVDFFWCLTEINTYHFTLFAFWPFLTFDPLTIGLVKRSLWTHFDVWPRPTLWQC